MDKVAKFINDTVKPILAFVIVVGTYAYFFSILIITGKVDPQTIIAVVAFTSGAIGYYYGFSQGAAKKDETIASMQQDIKNPVVNQADTVNVGTTKK